MLQNISHHHDVPHANPPFTAAPYAHDGKHHLLLACTGSVATIKLPNIVQALSSHDNLSILILLTPSATNFLRGQSAEQPHLDSIRRMNNVDGLFTDEDEWTHPWKRGQGILHIELRRWAHLMVIAPLGANTLAKITGGWCDGLVTSVVRAWDTFGEIDPVGVTAESDAVAEGEESVGGRVESRKKRIIVAPAMNTMMWRHPITKKQIRVLEEDWGVGKKSACEADAEPGWFEVLRPQEKELACGDVGDGAMRDWRDIVKIIEERLGMARSVNGQ